MNRHNLTYIDLHPAPVKRERRDWPHIVAAVVVFAAVGALLAWRG